MAFPRQASSQPELFSEINVTPLTDIFLVLLIIFMVTAAVTIESATHVGLPKVKTAVASAERPGVIVRYTAGREIYLNEQSLSEGELRPALEAVLSRSQDKLVVFKGEPNVVLGDTVRILDIAKSAGAERIGIAVARSGPHEDPDKSAGKGH